MNPKMIPRRFFYRFTEKDEFEEIIKGILMVSLNNDNKFGELETILK